MGVYSLFAFGLATGGPAFNWSVPIVVFGQFMVVFSFSEIASQFPLAGAIYQWAKRLVGPRYAFMSGWMYKVALLITVSAVAYAANLFAAPLFGWENTSLSTVLVAVAVIVLGGILNMLGIRRLALLARAGRSVADTLPTSRPRRAARRSGASYHVRRSDKEARPSLKHAMPRPSGRRAGCRLGSSKSCRRSPPGVGGASRSSR